MNLKIKSGTVGYNNKILVSDEKFSPGKNEKVNATFTKPEKETTKETTTIHKVVTQKPINPRRSKSCFDSLSHWWLYYLVYVSINTFRKISCNS